MTDKKSLIINAIQNMDSSMLDVLLDQSKVYQDVTKELFVEKMEAIFQNFKKGSDTFLFSHPGFCCSDDCTNKGCSGYSFVGNHSQNHIDLIIDEDGGEVNDIFQCQEFAIKNQEVDLKKRLFIKIMQDERADFKPSADFLIRSQKCRMAYDELMIYKDQVIGKELYIPWLEKYHALYKSFRMPPIFYADFNRFHSLYGGLEELSDYLKTSDYFKGAIHEFQTINSIDELQLLKWLIKHEKMAGELILFLYDNIDFEFPERSEFFEVRDLKIRVADFKFIARFKFLFDEYYWDMYEKYKLPEEEGSLLPREPDGVEEKRSSLSYFLKIRGIVK